MLHSVNTKIIAAFIVVFMGAFAALFFVSYTQIRQYEHDLTDSMGTAAAQDCATFVTLAADTDENTDFVPGSEDYEFCRESLRDICDANSMKYMYLCSYDLENSTITYIMAVGASDEDNELISRERPYGAVVKIDIDEVEKRALKGEDVRHAIVTNNQFGEMLDWFCRVDCLGDNVLAAASYPVLQQRARVASATTGVMFPFVVGFICLLIATIIILRKSVLKPLRTIADRMHGFSADSLETFAPLEIVSKDEIGNISTAFNEMADDIATYTAHIEHMTAERVHDQVELDIARRIQRGMVPERMETLHAGFSACGFSRPARSVGGDFYEIVVLDDGRIASVVGDTSGKGVAAALFMAMAKHLIHDCLLTSTGPADALLQANKKLVESNPEGMFISAFALVVDPATGEVRFANAGHMPPILIGSDIRLIEVDPGDLLGLYDDASIEEDTLFLEHGQSLLVYTDGAVEAKGPDNSLLGEDRFTEFLGAESPYAHAGNLIDTAVSSVDEFVGGCEQFDDLTMVAYVREPHQDDGLPCELASFGQVRKDIFATSVDEELKRKACLASEELFANIVSYSGATQIWAKVWEAEGSLHITLSDDGAAFDPTSSQAVEKDFEDLDSGGMGINLVRQLASSLHYRRDDARNVLTLTLS